MDRFTILDAKIGDSFTIISIKAEPKLMSRLISLGCYEGEVITLISKLSGNYIINIKNSRYAIGKTMAGSIIVERIEED